MAKHTPGPWKATLRTVTAPETEDRLPLDVRLYGGNADDNRANARLIAAAPDLLEALQECKQLLDMVLCVQGGLPPDANGPAAKALAAIRKATGAP